jgi:methyl-accepting chemotaxis protein
MNLARISVRNMLTAMALLVLLSMLAIAAIGMINIQRLDTALVSVTDTGQAVHRQMDADMMHDAIRADVLGALLAVRQGDATRTQAAQHDLSEHIERFKKEIAGNAQSEIGAAALHQSESMAPVLNSYWDTANEIITALAAGKADVSGDMTRFEQNFSTLEGEMEKLSDLIQAQAEIAKNDAHGRISGSFYSTATILVVSMIALGLLVRVLFIRVVHPLATLAQTASDIRDSGNLTLRAPDTHDNEIGHTVRAFNALLDSLQAIVREVRSDSEQIHRYGQSLSSAAQQTAGASEKQSEAASGMAAAMEQLSVSIDSMSEHAKTATQASGISGQLAGEGVHVVGEASCEIERIAESVRNSSNTIQRLGGKTDEITRIVSVIKDIADQTNLRALNAAIEAARAGEQGRGFAVVADEVRKLAERTAKSTGEISGMINEIQNGVKQAVLDMEDGVNRVASGVACASQAGASVERISKVAREAASAVTDITNALGEQSAAGRDIARNVEQVAQMSEQLHATANFTAEQAQSLALVAQSLEGSVNRFQV